MCCMSLCFSNCRHLLYKMLILPSLGLYYPKRSHRSFHLPLLKPPAGSYGFLVLLYALMKYMSYLMALTVALTRPL
jgi:hypothetical protein